MIKKIIAGLLCLSGIITAASSCVAPPSVDTGDGKVRISVTFNALREFVLAVGGDKVSVSAIIPDGTEPHDFEPKAQDLAALSTAQIFVINGFGMERWAPDAVKASGNSSLITIDASSGVSAITAGIAGHPQQDDPHIWLSLKCAETEVLNIKNALVKVDPANETYYEANYHDYLNRLELLYNKYREKFAAVQNKNFVTGHAAFAYLCREFGLTQNSVEDVFAEGEPSVKQLAALVDYCRTNDVKTIFSEALTSADIADTLAREVGASVKAINTIESNENGRTYLERMEENLMVIYESLK